MSDDSKPAPTNRPKPGAKIELFGYNLKVGFHPAIRLDSKKGWDFGKKISDLIEPKGSDFSGDSWSYMQPQGASPNCFLSVNVRVSDIQLNASFPIHPKEWYETRYAQLLRRFHEF